MVDAVVEMCNQEGMIKIVSIASKYTQGMAIGLRYEGDLSAETLKAFQQRKKPVWKIEKQGDVLIIDPLEGPSRIERFITELQASLNEMEAQLSQEALAREEERTAMILALGDALKLPVDHEDAVVRLW